MDEEGKEQAAEDGAPGSGAGSAGASASSAALKSRWAREGGGEGGGGEQGGAEPRGEAGRKRARREQDDSDREIMRELTSALSGNDSGGECGAGGRNDDAGVSLSPGCSGCVFMACGAGMGGRVCSLVAEAGLASCFIVFPWRVVLAQVAARPLSWRGRLR